MARFGQYGPHDEQERPEGDLAFTGVNCKLSPLRLSRGLLADARNVRLRRQVVEPRGGIVTPVEFNSTKVPTFFGCGLYSDPNSDNEWLLAAGSDRVWMLQDGCTPRWLALPKGERITAPCELVQCFNVVILFRGADASPLVWKGSIMRAPTEEEISEATGNQVVAGIFVGYHTEFEYIVKPMDPGDGTTQIPNAANGVSFANRLFVPFDRDQIGVSDVLDYTRYFAAMNQFRVNAGTNEELVCIFPYAATTLLAFKSRSVWSLEHVSGDLTQVTLTPVNVTVGCCARRSVCMVGGDCYFLSSSPAGVFRVQQVVQERLQTAVEPVSSSVEPWVQRINWKHAGGACAALHNEYYFLGVPVDESTTNNAVFVYNTVSGQWESFDTFPEGVAVEQFFVTLRNGERRLFAVDLKRARVYLLGEGAVDRIGEEETPVRMSATTRAYSLTEQNVNDQRLLNSLARKRFSRLSAIGSTWNPEFHVEVLFDGVNNVVELINGERRDRTRWAVWGKMPYHACDRETPHTAPRREDYSVVCPFICKPGLGLNLRQDSFLRLPIRSLSQSAQVRFTNGSGQMEISRVTLEGTETELGRKAQIL